MNVMGLVNSPLAWVLKQWFRYYLVMDADAETLMVQLSSRPLVLRRVPLNTDCFNKELRKFGVELVRGYVSQGELCVVDWSSLSVSVEVETVSLCISRGKEESSRQMHQEADSPVGGFSSLVSMKAWWKSVMENLEVWFKRFMTNLKVHVRHVIIEFEDRGRCVGKVDLHDVHYETASSDGVEEMCPRLGAASVHLSLMHAPAAAATHRIVEIKNAAVQIQLGAEGKFTCSCGAGSVDIDIDPDAVDRLLALVLSNEKDARDGRDTNAVPSEAPSGTDVVFYDAEEYDRESSAGSDMTESVYFDCEETYGENDVDGPLPKSLSVAFTVNIPCVSCHLRSSTESEYRQLFVLCLDDLSCSGRYDEGIELDVTIGGLGLTDESPNSSSITVQRSVTGLPETLRSLIPSHRHQRSYLRFGFQQLERRQSIALNIKKQAQNLKIDVGSIPIVFWFTCESVQRCLSLIQSFRLPLNRHRSQPSSLSLQTEVAWTIPGLFGAMERPRAADHQPEGLFSVELKAEEDRALLSYKKPQEGQPLSTWARTDVAEASVSIAELSVHHCHCIESIITSCRNVLLCRSSAERTSVFSTERALTIDVAKQFGRRRITDDLSSLAYALVHLYSQAEAASVQERTLSRVEFEGRCVNTADIMYDVVADSLELDATIDDVEAFMEALLQFWCPSKMADQMKSSHIAQTVLIFKAQRIKCRLQNGAVTDLLQPLEVDIRETEVCMVSGIQRKTISTFAATLNEVVVTTVVRRQLCRIVNDEDDDRPAVQFFQVSELDYRNAKFKQWEALQQQHMKISVDNSVAGLRWVVQSVMDLLAKNKERILTDIDVETVFSFATQATSVQYKTSPVADEHPTEVSLKFELDNGNLCIRNLRRLTAELRNVTLLLESGECPCQEVAHDALLQCFIRPSDGELDVEIKNDRCTLGLDPRSLSALVRVVWSLIQLSSDLYQPQTEDNCSEMSVDDQPLPSILEGVSDDVFSLKNERSSMKESSAFDRLVEREDDEDGFVLVEDIYADSKNDPLRASMTKWLESECVEIKEDYITLPEQLTLVDEDYVVQESRSPETVPVQWRVRCINGSVRCSFFGPDRADHVDATFDGVNMAYACFQRGSPYESRWAVSIQEVTMADHRADEEGKRILERNRSQLKTEFSKRINQAQTLSLPMFQISLETVVPDVTSSSKMTEKRFDLHIVPLRLRLSKSLNDFSKLFIRALPQSPSHSSRGEGPYFQMCTVSAMFVVMDYRPRSIDLERLRRGKTSELANAVQWEGLEFYLNEMKESGIHGWSHVLSFISQNWTHDIAHSQAHRLLSGFPALGVIKRVSPAAQDVIHAAASKVARREHAEMQVRGAHVPDSQSLSRALGEFGRVFSLEVLNLCANSAEGVQLVLDGADTHSAPSTARDGLHKAGAKLKKAAQSVFTDPLHRARSGEGIGVAMTSALWAVPKALLAPASAATTFVQGTLRSACDALDTENVLNS